MPDKYEEYDESNYDSGADQQITGATWIAQTFTPNLRHNITSVKLYTRRVGNPGTLTVSIKETDVNSKPTGTDLASGSIDGNTIATTYVENEVIFSAGKNLAANVKYAIVARATAGDGSNYVEWGYDGSAASYAGGGEVVSLDSGATWGIEEPTVDEIFEEWGNPPTFIPQVFIF